MNQIYTSFYQYGDGILNKIHITVKLNAILLKTINKLQIILVISTCLFSCENQTNNINTALDSDSLKCGRTVRNSLNSSDIFLSNWSAVPNKKSLKFDNNFRKVTFNLANTENRRLFIGKSLLLKNNTNYALRIDVSNFSGKFEDDNFLIFNANNTNFIGKTSTKFIQDGTYGLVFKYKGEDKIFIIRLGIGTAKDDNLATNDNNSHFTIEKVMVEELPEIDNSPSEYVPPNNNWGFNYEKSNTYDTRTGIVNEKNIQPCGTRYDRSWAIIADSFGNDTSDFPNQLISNISKNYAFYTDAEPGRTLSSAFTDYKSLINLKAYPPDIARVYGAIIQGGINDVITDTSFFEMTKIINEYTDFSRQKNLKLIILTISPFKNNQNWNISRETVRVAYNDWLNNTISRMPGITIYDISKKIYNGGLADEKNIEILASEYDGNNPILFNGDGLHPNPVGSLKIANEIKKILDNIIAAK